MISANNLGALYDPELGGDAVALIDCRVWQAPREYSHRALHEAADAVARGLLARGLRQGDTVGLLSANRAEYLIAYMGALRAGLIAVPVNYKFPAETVAYILNDADVKLVFADAARLALLPSAAPRVSFDDESYAGLLDPGPFTHVVPDDDTVAMVLYTSGSTGRPKGVPLTHAGHLWALRQRVRRGWPFTHHRLLVAAPLFHMNALCTSLFTFAASASQVLLPEFEATHYLEAIERYRCTWITSVPTMIAMCMARPDVVASTDLSSVTIVRMGSAPVSPKLWSQVREVFPKANIMNVYGTTEAGPVVFAPRPDTPLPDGSVGWAAPEVDLKLVDAAGREADEGVLWQRMPAVTPGYLNLPDKTAEVLTTDGWYISGDVFRRDDDGAYYFVGRSDDMFNCGGENIYPGEVEAVLVGHPDIVEACVVPVPDEIKGEKPVAYVVARPGAMLDAETVKQHALANAPAYQHPRQVHFLDALPLAGPGKVDRKGLTDRARALGRDAPLAAAGD
tara:strand:- start:237 stop:1760 length:1524 start_codon:yes stop_codon:yes gene_type:complete